MCAPVSQTRPESSEGEFLDDSNFPSRRHCGSPSFLRDSSVQEQGMCAPVCQTTPNSSGGEAFDVSTYLPGNTIGLGLLRVRQTHIS